MLFNKSTRVMFFIIVVIAAISVVALPVLAIYWAHLFAETGNWLFLVGSVFGILVDWWICFKVLPVLRWLWAVEKNDTDYMERKLNKIIRNLKDTDFNKW